MSKDHRQHDPPLIVQLIERFSFGGGAEGQLCTLAGALPAHGLRTEVWFYKDAPADLGSAPQDGIVVRKVPGHGRPPLRFAWNLYRRLRETRCDLLHTWMTSANFYGRVVGGLLAGVPVMSAERTSRKSRALILTDRLFAPASRAMVANSEGVREFLLSAERLPDRKVVVIPNGVDTVLFRPRDDGRIARNELGIPTDGFLVGTLGRHIEDKRQEWLVRVVARLRAEGLDVRGAIAGWGERRGLLEREATSAGVSSYVHFLGLQRDVPQLLAAFDIFLLPSVREGMPNVVLEAMAMGIPVVATDVPGVRDLLDRHPGPIAPGIVTPSDDEEAFVAAARRLLADANHRRLAGQMGRQVAERHFSRERMVEAYVGLYRRILDSKAGA